MNQEYKPKTPEEDIKVIGSEYLDTRVCFDLTLYLCLAPRHIVSEVDQEI